MKKGLTDEDIRSAIYEVIQEIIADEENPTKTLYEKSFQLPGLQVIMSRTNPLRGYGLSSSYL